MMLYLYSKIEKFIEKQQEWKQQDMEILMQK